MKCFTHQNKMWSTMISLNELSLNEKRELCGGALPLAIPLAVKGAKVIAGIVTTALATAGAIDAVRDFHCGYQEGYQGAAGGEE